MVDPDVDTEKATSPDLNLPPLFLRVLDPSGLPRVSSAAFPTHIPPETTAHYNCSMKCEAQRREARYQTAVYSVVCAYREANRKVLDI